MKKICAGMCASIIVRVRKYKGKGDEVEKRMGSTRGLCWSSPDNSIIASQAIRSLREKLLYKDGEKKCEGTAKAREGARTHTRTLVAIPYLSP